MSYYWCLSLKYNCFHNIHPVLPGDSRNPPSCPTCLSVEASNLLHLTHHPFSPIHLSPHIHRLNVVRNWELGYKPMRSQAISGICCSLVLYISDMIWHVIILTDCDTPTVTGRNVRMRGNSFLWRNSCTLSFII